MAELLVEGDQVVVHMGRWEQLAALRGDVQVPLAAVRSATLEPDPWGALRGLRAPGTAWPRRIAYGIWRSRGERPDFVAMRRETAVIRVELDPPAEFRRLLVSVDDAAATLMRLDGSR